MGAAGGGARVQITSASRALVSAVGCMRTVRITRSRSRRHRGARQRWRAFQRAASAREERQPILRAKAPRGSAYARVCTARAAAGPAGARLRGNPSMRLASAPRSSRACERAAAAACLAPHTCCAARRRTERESGHRAAPRQGLGGSEQPGRYSQWGARAPRAVWRPDGPHRSLRPASTHTPNSRYVSRRCHRMLLCTHLLAVPSAPR